jgi:hypothetical protein
MTRLMKSITFNMTGHIDEPDQYDRVYSKC